MYTGIAGTIFGRICLVHASGFVATYYLGSDQYGASQHLLWRHKRIRHLFYYQKTGEPVRFVAQRYKEAGGTCTLEEWSVRIRAYKNFQDILIPSQGEVSLNLRTRPFHWLRFEVKEARLDQALK